MERTLSELSVTEFERLIERTIDRRFQVWLTQLTDALAGEPETNGAELDPAFAASLRESLEQARAGQLTDLDSFRTQLKQ